MPAGSSSRVGGGGSGEDGGGNINKREVPCASLGEVPCTSPSHDECISHHLSISPFTPCSNDSGNASSTMFANDWQSTYVLVHWHPDKDELSIVEI